MSLQEAKELFGTLFFGSAIGTLVISWTMYKFAEITYKVHAKKIKGGI